MSMYVDLSNPKIFHIGRDKYGNGIYHIPPDLPTDDAVERKNGKWIDNISCSECGWVNQVESGFIGTVKGFNFCPNCGADMRGEQDG